MYTLSVHTSKYPRKYPENDKITSSVHVVDYYIHRILSSNTDTSKIGHYLRITNKIYPEEVCDNSVQYEKVSL